MDEFTKAKNIFTKNIGPISDSISFYKGNSLMPNTYGFLDLERFPSRLFVIDLNSNTYQSIDGAMLNVVLNNMFDEMP